MDSIRGLPKEDPRRNKEIKYIKSHICDVKNRLVFCCGAAQVSPGEYVSPPLGTRNVHFLYI